MLPLIYVAGPFGAETGWDIEQNIREAEQIGWVVTQAGASAVIPHANTRNFTGTMTDEYWYAATLALLAKCDGIVLHPRWKQSAGATMERHYALKNDIPVCPFYPAWRVFWIRDWLVETFGEDRLWGGDRG